jgi:3-methyl-2-oxobutanoate hydroxymethyltransferase
MVVLGYESTIPVSMEEMLHHSRAVRRGAGRALLCGDMPFMSYQASVSEAVANAGRFLKEGGMEAVKLEGGRRVAETVRAVTQAGIPVMGHVGLTPQSVNALGGYRVQGRDREAARSVLEDALALEDAGCFAIVLESVPQRLATHLTSRLSIPTIGIGAGAGTGGQVLVYHDLLGYGGLAPRFVKRFADVRATMVEALRDYCDAVTTRRFPTSAHCYGMPDEEWEAFMVEQRSKSRGEAAADTVLPEVGEA